MYWKIIFLHNSYILIHFILVYIMNERHSFVIFRFRMKTNYFRYKNMEELHCARKYISLFQWSFFPDPFICRSYDKNIGKLKRQLYNWKKQKSDISNTKSIKFLLFFPGTKRNFFELCFCAIKTLYSTHIS